MVHSPDSPRQPYYHRHQWSERYRQLSFVYLHWDHVILANVRMPVVDDSFMIPSDSLYQLSLSKRLE